MKKSTVVLLHFSYWMLYLLLVMAFFIIMPGNNKPIFSQALFSSHLSIVSILPAVLGFYCFYSLLFHKFLRKKRLVGLLLSSAVVSIACGIVCSAVLYLAWGSRFVFNDGWNSAIAETGFFSVLAFVHGVIALVMNGFISWFSEVKMREELNKKNYDMELELIKSQSNPHFLFNTINNIDVLIKKDPDQASNYLNKLSDIMRFLLYETKDEKIPLSKELNYIEKYIELQKIRTSNTEYIEYNVEGNVTNETIAPFTLIPFIENAFKHAESKKSDNAINIDIKVEKESVKLSCSNKYIENSLGKIENSNGLGNDLIKRRLMLLYPNRHILKINTDKGIYSANLEVWHHEN